MEHQGIISYVRKQGAVSFIMEPIGEMLHPRQKVVKDLRHTFAVFITTQTGTWYKNKTYIRVNVKKKRNLLGLCLKHNKMQKGRVHCLK